MTPKRRAVIDRVLLHEGGIADVGDGKGVTRFGQTPAWLEDHGFVPPTTAEQAVLNYETWIEQTGLGAVCDLDPSVGYVVVDFAVHSGLAAAVKALQRALGGLAVDGVLGPRTRAALVAVSPRAVAHRVVAERVRYLGLLLQTPSNSRYAGGWLNRIAAHVEALA